VAQGRRRFSHPLDIVAASAMTATEFRFPMRSDGSYVFGDLVGHVDVVCVACDKCGREGSYSVRTLINKHGPNCKVADLICAITADCAKSHSLDETDHCGAHWPDLVKVFVD